MAKLGPFGLIPETGGRAERPKIKNGASGRMGREGA